MNGNFVRLSNYLIPLAAISAIDLNYPRPQGEGGGTGVRVWLNGGTLPNYAMPGLQQFAVPGQTCPTFLDFRGVEAQNIRRWCEKSVDTGLVTSILETPTTAHAIPATAQTAGPKSIGRPKKHKTQAATQAAAS